MYPQPPADLEPDEMLYTVDGGWVCYRKPGGQLMLVADCAGREFYDYVTIPEPRQHAVIELTGDGEWEGTVYAKISASVQISGGSDVVARTRRR